MGLNLILKRETRKIFYPEVVEKFVEVILLLSPVIIVESIAGGYIGYKIFERVKKSECI